MSDRDEHKKRKTGGEKITQDRSSSRPKPFIISFNLGVVGMSRGCLVEYFSIFSFNFFSLFTLPTRSLAGLPLELAFVVNYEAIPGAVNPEAENKDGM